MMNTMNLQKIRRSRRLAVAALLLAIVATAALAFAHGGKHSDKFTQLQALQNATKLYDQLIAKGKLDPSWENGLQNVAITNRTQNDRDEIVVAFERKEGNPNRVYIFFTAEGKYAGSNFTGE